MTAASVERLYVVRLQAPGLAVDEFGNRGRWTMVYNQGFELSVNDRSYFAFSAFQYTDDDVISYCDRTTPGWAHDVTLRHWSCFTAKKLSSNHTAKVHKTPKIHGRDQVVPEQHHRSTVQRVNSAQSSWTAQLHEPVLGLTRGQLLARRGGERAWLPHRPAPAPASKELKMAAASLPPRLDWRNMSGVNFVSPVKNQGGCGSCYVFSATGMLESRLRIRTGDTQQALLSEQQVLACSRLSQGCEGGFPYLVGRYAQGHGVVESSCYPAYSGVDTECRNSSCDRHFAARYRYVGGYFGGCNEEGMMLALMRGPIAVNFLSYDDLDHYKSGVYHHTGAEQIDDTFPYHAVDHAVLVVGYGTHEVSGEKYWIVKNSWGDAWGDHGYFLMRRGTNECGIESLASEADPIP
ncbi:dipeptidyl peptidase 1-like isoform X2 [Bacillus rossius redtenbacheri]